MLAVAVMVGGGMASGAEVLLNFDDAADGTLINNRYPGVTFSNPIGSTAGGNIYARSGSGFAPSVPNVVSVFATGLPEFDARYGAVDARFAVPMRSVRVDVRPVAPLEFVLPLTKRPYLQAFDAAGALIGSAYYQGALPTGVGEIGPVETLTVTAPGNSVSIVTARFSTQNPVGSTPTYGLFDNLRYDRGYYTLTTQVSGGGSVTVSPLLAEYPVGSVVTVKAEFAPGWAFSGWLGGPGGTTNPLTLTMTTDTTLTARFSSLVSTIVVDNRDATIVGRGWSNLVDATCYAETCVAVEATGDPRVYALFEPGVEVPGRYDVWAWYPNTRGLGARETGYLIRHADGETLATLNQAVGGGRWTLLTSGLRFAPGAPASVRVHSPAEEEGRALVADAVRLVWSGSQTWPAIVASAQRDFECVAIGWNAVPGRTYRLQYKSSLSNLLWVELPGDVTASGWTAFRQDCTLGRVGQRFYRVQMLPQ